MSFTSSGGALLLREAQEKLIAKAEKSILDSELLSIDLEFSGLFINDNRNCKTIEEYYEICSQSVKQFLVVQLGVCTAKRSQSDPNHWILTPFTFYLFPSSKKLFTTDSKSIQWLVEQGFDPLKWIKEGYDYEQLSKLASPHYTLFTNNKVRTYGVQRLIDAIIEKPKPLIVHNGLLDLLHLCDKFIENLPSTIDEFTMRFKTLFPRGIYDTKRIATAGRNTVFHISDSSRGATTLESLRYLLLNSQYDKNGRKISVSLETSSRGKGYSLDQSSHSQRNRKSRKRKLAATEPPLSVDHDGPSQNEVVVIPSATDEEIDGDERATAIPSIPVATAHSAHDAGHDAMMTLHVFLLEMDRAHASTSPSGNHSLSEWQSLPVLESAFNKVELVGISPGYVDFNLSTLDEKPDGTEHQLDCQTFKGFAYRRACEFQLQQITEPQERRAAQRAVKGSTNEEKFQNLKAYVADCLDRGDVIGQIVVIPFQRQKTDQELQKEQQLQQMRTLSSAGGSMISGASTAATGSMTSGRHHRRAAANRRFNWSDEEDSASSDGSDNGLSDDDDTGSSRRGGHLSSMANNSAKDPEREILYCMRRERLRRRHYFEEENSKVTTPSVTKLQILREPKFIGLVPPLYPSRFFRRTW